MMASKDIAEKTGNALVTVIKWASENGVEYVGEGMRKTYIWSEADFERFKARNKARGRPKTKKED